MNRRQALFAARAIAQHAEIAIACLEDEKNDGRGLVREVIYRANKIEAELLRLRAATADKRLHVIHEHLNAIEERPE